MSIHGILCTTLYEVTWLLSVLATISATSFLTSNSAAQDRPNIVWIMAEDIGCDLTCYGTPALQTPILDRLAKQGHRFTRAYVTAPICSPARSAMMTGVYQESIDAHHHRSHRKDGFRLPTPFRPITHLLHDAGYYCALGCGYGAKTDLNFSLGGAVTKKLFDGDDWSNRKEGQPFFAHIQLRVTHRGVWWEETKAESHDPVQPSEVKLPSYLPDQPVVREDWALYLDQIEKADRQVGEILARIESEGLLQNTLVIFMGDNGRCHIRGKGFLYEDGVRVPLIVHWPGHVEGGLVRDQLVSSIDISYEVLAAASAATPDYLQGIPFFDPTCTPRDIVFASRDRWDMVLDKSRCAVTERFKYIRNDMPHVPWDARHDYLERWRPMLPVLRKMHEQGTLTKAQSRFFLATKPTEELYDLKDDPLELNNLADDRDSLATLIKLRNGLVDWEATLHEQPLTPHIKKDHLSQLKQASK